MARIIYGQTGATALGRGLMRAADDDDEEMDRLGGYTDPPEEGLSAIAAKATPMPKW